MLFVIQYYLIHNDEGQFLLVFFPQFGLDTKIAIFTLYFTTVLTTYFTLCGIESWSSLDISTKS